MSGTGKNYAYSVLYRLSICVLPLVVTPYIARVLGAENNGVYVFTSVIACVFIMLSKLGLENYGNRSIAVCRDDPEARSRVFFSIYALQAITSLLSVALFAAFILLTRPAHAPVYWMQMMYVASALFDVSWFFYGMEKFKLTTLRSLISRALIIAGVFCFVRSRDDLIVYTAVMSACFLLEQCLLFPVLRRYVRPVRLKLRDVTRHIKPNLTLFVPILALSVYHWMDKIMLGVMVNESAVSYYNYAESIINLPKGIVQAMGTVMLPQISYMVAHQRQGECAALFRDSMELVCFIGCALCFIIMGVSPVFVPFFLGPEYMPTVLLTMELAIVMIPMSVSDVVQTQHLIPFGRDMIYVWSIVIGAAVNVALNFALIPLYGASGAVIGTLGAEIAVCVYQLRHVRAFYAVRALAGSLLPYMGFGLLAGLLALLLGKLSLSALPLLCVQVAASGGLYLLLCTAYFAVMRRKNADYLSPPERLRRGARPDERAVQGGDAD